MTGPHHNLAKRSSNCTGEASATISGFFLFFELSPDGEKIVREHFIRLEKTIHGGPDSFLDLRAIAVTGKRILQSAS
jgi:hypothetical protein